MKHLSWQNSSWLGLEAAGLSCPAWGSTAQARGSPQMISLGLQLGKLPAPRPQMPDSLGDAISKGRVLGLCHV